MTTVGPRLRVTLAWLPVIAYSLLIWWLSSQTFEFTLLERVPFQDKGVHFLEYGALGFFIAYAVAITWPQRGMAGGLVAVAMTAALGLIDELHQAFVPGRSSDAYDLIVDCAGAFAAALAFGLLARVFRSLTRPRERLLD